MKNNKLKEAFEKAAQAEINALPKEEQIIRVYSDEHLEKMEKMFEARNEKKSRTVKFKKFRWAAVIAAVLIMSMLTVSVSAGKGMWELFDFKHDPEKQVVADLNISDSYIEGEGMEEYMYLEYKGKPLTVKYSLDKGTESDEPARAVMLLINGVRQTFDAKLGDKTFEDVDILKFELGVGELQLAELTFEPNMGKKGDELALEIVTIYDPEDNHYTYCSYADGLFEGHWDDDDNNICDKCELDLTEQPMSGPGALTVSSEQFLKLVMKKNAPEQADLVCENFSGAVESDLHEKIKGYYSDYDQAEGMLAIVYKDVDKDIYYDETGSLTYKTVLETTPKEDDKFTINVHGHPGQYRLAFYIGAEPQAVFDGKDYVDVEIKEGKQVELNISLDTTKLNEQNKFHIVYRLVGDDLFREGWWWSQQLYRYGRLVVE